MRPIAVWNEESVYWGTLSTVKTLQGLHWNDLKNSKPLRYFWYAYGSMFAYEWFPAYMWPWLNSVSIPCLASMKATGSKAAVLTNLFGGATNNEGLGLLSLGFDWQYISTHHTPPPPTPVDEDRSVYWNTSAYAYIYSFLSDIPSSHTTGTSDGWDRGMLHCYVGYIL